MKNKYLIYIIVSFGLFFQSCNDWLELLPPQDLVQAEYWKTKEDVQAVLMGAYQQTVGLSDELFLFGEIRADMVRVSSNKTNWLNAKNSKITPEDGFTSWSAFYSVINRCNYVLEFGPGVRNLDNTFTDYQLKGYESEAYFLRSLMYFNLVKIFGRVPLVLTSSKSDGNDFYVRQTSEDSVLTQIISDLNIARTQATGAYADLANTKGRATKGAINSLLADIYLWRASGQTDEAKATSDYNNCIKYADEVINDGQYLLLPGLQWFTNYYPGNSLESIFEFQFNQSLKQNNALYDLTYGTNLTYYPSTKAHELIVGEGESTEVWRTATLNSSGKIWKYAGKSSNLVTTRSSDEQRSGNFIIYRLPDLILMKAEALIFTNRAAEGYDLINKIRVRAFLEELTVPSGIKEQEDDLLNERAIEFAFEGKRWWDLMRMGRRTVNGIKNARKKDFIEIVVAEVSAKDRLVLANRLLDPNGWYWPVNYNELDVNANLVQNPYYADYKKK